MVFRLRTILSALLLLATSAVAGAQATFYVSLTGNDASDGSAARPFRTIQRGIDLAHFVVAEGLYSSVERGVVLVGSGVFEQELPVRIKPHVELIGQGVYETTIRTTRSLPEGYVGVAMEWDCSMERIKVELPGRIAGPGTARLVLLDQAYAGPVRVEHCILDGGENPGPLFNGVESVGVEVIGGDCWSVVIGPCKIGGVTTGIRAIGSGVNITRVLFENIAGDAVVVLGPLAKQSGVTVPLLGCSDDLRNTGLNQFRNVGGLCINNMTGTEVRAEMNDWGVYDRDAVAGRIGGAADTGPFLGKGIGAGSVVASVLDSGSNPVPAFANPACTIPALSMTGVYDTESQRFVFNGVNEGQWNVEASASGYVGSSATVDVSSFTVSSVTLHLSGGGCGSAGGKAAYAGCAFLIWVAGRRRRGRPRPPKS